MPMDAPRVDFRAFDAEIRAAAQTWTQSSVFARENPDGSALISSLGNRTFSQLHENANRLANALRSMGLNKGDALALLCRNRPEFIEVFLAALRIGLRLTPVNTHLTAAEVSYVVVNCEARVFVAEAALLAALDVSKLAIGNAHLVEIGEAGDAPNLDATKLSLSALLQTGSPALPPNCVCGTQMLYTSGTTGKPKGVYREAPEFIDPQYAGSFADYNPATDIALCCGPAYHSAPLLFDLRWPLASGVPIVLLDKWGAEKTLAAMQQYHVTHAHMVATMFQRLLALPPEVRARYDLSAFRFLVHGAAPCPVPLKRAMIEWLGPILIEYYGATEGGDGIHIGSEEWLQHPGSVGKLNPASGHVILDEEGNPCAVGGVGKIYFKAPSTGRFEYFRDPEKTAVAYADDRFTLGDMGYVDAEGYLFLTGRVAECIISGGVNIYPQEVDEALLSHPLVEDVCTVGAPDEEWGEKVVSVVVLRDARAATEATLEQLSAHAAQHLAGFKRPRQIVFANSLPRSASGKLLRQQVRQTFWAGRERTI
jgi:long-chain acyl-CoA synthetase